MVKREEDIAIIKLVEDLMEYGYHSRASDVHVDPELDRVRIRLRVDGVLQDAFVFPKKFSREIITRIKVLSRSSHRRTSGGPGRPFSGGGGGRRPC